MLGFPILRLVALICLGSGAVCDAAMGPCVGKGGDEQTLLREVLDNLQSGDILLGDAYYATNFLLAKLIGHGIDGVFEQYGARRRSTDFSCGTSLGERDHVITLSKPTRPEWMSPEEYAQVQDTIEVRELQSGGKTLVTTFLDPKATPKGILKALYRRRWHVEEAFRDLKSEHYGKGLERSRSRSAGRFTVLVLIASLAAFLLWLLGTAASHQALHQRLRPGSRQRNAYSRLFLARLLLTLQTYRDLIEELVAAVVSVDQWVSSQHAALFPQMDAGN